NETVHGVVPWVTVACWIVTPVAVTVPVIVTVCEAVQFVIVTFGLEATLIDPATRLTRIAWFAASPTSTVVGVPVVISRTDIWMRCRRAPPSPAAVVTASASRAYCHPRRPAA